MQSRSWGEDNLRNLTRGLEDLQAVSDDHDALAFTPEIQLAYYRKPKTNRRLSGPYNEI